MRSIVHVLSTMVIDALQFMINLVSVNKLKCITSCIHKGSIRKGVIRKGSNSYVIVREFVSCTFVFRHCGRELLAVQNQRFYQMCVSMNVIK